MKEGNQITNSAIEMMQKCRRRRGTNFSESKQKQRRDLKRREDASASASGSLRKPRASEVGGRPLWQLDCKIQALDLEPIEEVGQPTTDGDLSLGCSISVVLAQGQRENASIDSKMDSVVFETNNEAQDASGEMVSNNVSNAA